MNREGSSDWHSQPKGPCLFWKLVHEQIMPQEIVKICLVKW